MTTTKAGGLSNPMLTLADLMMQSRGNVKEVFCYVLLLLTWSIDSRSSCGRRGHDQSCNAFGAG